MPNFEAQVRLSYRDVAGLVLSCARGDIVEDPNNPGFVREWINRAPGLPSQPAIRQPGDPDPTYLGGRFSNLIQKDQALQPTLATTGGGENRVQFDRARSTFMDTDAITEELSAIVRPLACAYQFEAGGDASNNQTILDATDSVLVVQRRDGSGDAVIDAGGSLTTVGGDHADGTFLFTGLAAGTSVWQLDGGAYGTGLSTAIQYDDSEVLLVGRDPVGNYLDGILDSVHLWACELSPKTLDLIWQSLSQDDVDFSSDPRAVMNNVVWTDVTGDATTDEYDRLRPQTGFPHRYILVDLPTGPVAQVVQVAAAVNGIPVPDSELGGDLFAYKFAEFPGASPVLTQDAGWSSIADFTLNAVGHYTLIVTRDSGGSVVLHFDVQEL